MTQQIYHKIQIFLPSYPQQQNSSQKQIFKLFLFLITNQDNSPYLCQMINSLILGLLIVLIEYSSSQISSVGLILNNGTITMYSNNSYAQNFVQKNNLFVCSFNSLYTYSQTPAQKYNNSGYTLQINGASNASISISSVHGHIFPQITPNFCNTSSCSIYITNNCPINLNGSNYFDLINVDITGLSQMSYFVICDSTIKPFVFQWGQFILIVITAIVLTVATLKSKYVSMGGRGLEYNWICILVFSCAILLGGLLTIFNIQVAGILADIAAWIVGIASMTIVLIEGIYLIFKTEKLRKTLVYKQISVRIMDIIGFFIGFLWVIGWWVSGKNWILTDIISICIIFAVIKVFKFVSFKMAFISYSITIIIQISLLITIQLIKSQNYDGYLLNTLNTPFQFQTPAITPMYNEKCSWLSVSAIVYPGLLIAYLRRFDKSRNTNVYLISCIVTYITGSVVWMVIGTFSQYSLPFGIITEPIMMGAFSLFAFKRKELRTLWEGKFYDTEFVNKDAVAAMEIQMVKQSPNTDYFKQNLTNGLNLNPLEDSMIEARSQLSEDRRNTNM